MEAKRRQWRRVPPPNIHPEWRRLFRIIPGHVLPPRADLERRVDLSKPPPEDLRIEPRKVVKLPPGEDLDQLLKASKAALDEYLLLQAAKIAVHEDWNRWVEFMCDDVGILKRLGMAAQTARFMNWVQHFRPARDREEPDPLFTEVMELAREAVLSPCAMGPVERLWELAGQEEGQVREALMELVALVKAGREEFSEALEA